MIETRGAGRRFTRWVSLPLLSRGTSRGSEVFDMPRRRTVDIARTPASPYPARGPTVTAALDDGPLRGVRIEAEVVAGRPPSTIDVPADDGGMCRYCLVDWVQSGPSAAYSFLYLV
ncbi:MAG: hypothetical protein QOD81_1251 [Solirubrobacteraceae bacterium]|jgi:hypothetical protein|nr:hypothetical protein [Solirubrobacteraceae bacterium]